VSVDCRNFEKREIFAKNCQKHVLLEVKTAGFQDLTLALVAVTFLHPLHHFKLEKKKKKTF
jgi:hypothetical protein